MKFPEKDLKSDIFNIMGLLFLQIFSLWKYSHRIQRKKNLKKNSFQKAVGTPCIGEWCLAAPGSADFNNDHDLRQYAQAMINQGFLRV